ncbi:MAG: AraC family transcriptional regulator [Myxococcaceae bacterium]|jgi:AraC-like DNA-binding protein|nr:AraC family transcriptional regulator [Myxococcaceae bacterium]
MPRSSFEMTSRVAPIVLAFAQSRGLDPKSLIEKHQLPADLDWRQAGKLELTLPAQRLKGLVDDVADTLRLPHLGLELARALPKGSYGVAEFLMRSAATVRGACENLVRFNSLLAPHQSFRFDETDREAQLHHGIVGSPDAMSVHHHEYTTLVLVTTFHSMVDEGRVNRVWFTHPKVADVAPLTEAFGTDALSFDAELNGFSFDRRFLDMPVKTGDAALYAFLEEHALAALASRPKSDDLIDRVRQNIREALKAGEPNIERIATRLALSGRTLQRRLSDIGTSFQAVLDDVRFDLARAYLKDVRLDITQVAYLLGYSELRAFDRAFKRWANVTPREWREHRPG